MAFDPVSARSLGQSGSSLARAPTKRRVDLVRTFRHLVQHLPFAPVPRLRDAWALADPQIGS
jgi:hypothetical protein